MQLSHRNRSHLFVGLALLLTLLGVSLLRRGRQEEPLFPSPALTEVRRLSDYHPPLAGTAGDTAVYLFDSGVPGGTLLVLGGTHANEPAGSVAAILLLENLRVTAGRALLIPHTNASAFTHNDSQEAMLQRFTIATAAGPRWFRNGSRYTNPVAQWPDPTIYVNPRGRFWEAHKEAFPEDTEGNPGPGGAILAGIDGRNLNRCYPGTADGTLTEQVAFAITTLVRAEEVDLAVDLHEAAPEYPTVNVIVAHQRAEMIALGAELLLDEDGIAIVTDTSVLTLRGLSHRELGDATQAHACLLETACPSMGRFKGRTSAAQIVAGRDPCYRRAQLIQDRLNARLARRAEQLAAAGREVDEKTRRIVQVHWPEEGVPLATRAGRHLNGVVRLVESFSDEHPQRAIALAGVPTIDDLRAAGVGAFLHGPGGELPGGCS
ncbi:MAG: succinylglutamate desuccinylase [bacterium]|nr:succinylglutamate desuccinylase [bacterium]